MAYSREDIDRVRERTDLVELASEVTRVKRSGRSVMAVCPFHSEKTPSLSIDPARGLFHCFGCGKSGDIFGWIQETQGLGFSDALELLARRASVTLTKDPDAAKRRDRRERLVDAVEQTVLFYNERLRTADDAGHARSYLRSRGYDADVVEQFHLGYAPDGWEALVNHLRGSGVSDEAMVGAGLASKSRRGGLVDRFRNRLMFPIYDVRGDAVGFGARLLDGDGPKYLNSPETPIYHKSRLLYGLNWAKSQIVRSDESVVVEGYTDVIALHLADMPVAVATCGTALGEEHLDLLRRFSKRVVLAFDADEAGAGAAERGFEHSVPGDLDLRVAILPEGRDPADLVSEGDVDDLKAAIASSIPLLQFRIDRELAGFDMTEPEARGRAVRAAAALISLHPDAVVRHEYAVLVSRRTGVDVAAVESALTGTRRGAGASPPVDERQLTGPQRTEREVLRLLLANDPGIRSHDVSPDLFSVPLHREALAIVMAVVEPIEPGVAADLGAAIGSDDRPEAALLRSLAMRQGPLADADDVMKRLKQEAVERRIEALGADLDVFDADVDPQGYSDRFERLIALQNERRELRSRE
ncbi:MAG: DNA primase [Acidimicrobiia bacterium]|nr:DNA primase [Acidimicrobiia bacterium]